MFDHESIIGISLVFTPEGFISDRVGGEDGRGVRWEWWLAERPRLLLLGNTQDPLLESLWSVMPEMRLFGTARTLDFDLATGLNFSLYVERPRLEHLYRAGTARAGDSERPASRSEADLYGVSSLKTMARLHQIFLWYCFCNSVCQYLAQRHIRLRREGMCLVLETVTGNPSVVMSHSIEVYKRFLQELVDQRVECYGCSG